jgi:hypothetical protein
MNKFCSKTTLELPTLNKCKILPDYYAEMSGADYFKCTLYTIKIEALEVFNLSDCHSKYLYIIFYLQYYRDIQVTGTIH